MNSTYVINNENGTSASELLLSIPVAGTDTPGWSIQTHSAAGIDYAMLIADEDAAVFPLHEDANEWFGYVVEGSGELHLGTADEVTEKVNYKAGDILLFKPNTYHGWKSHSKTSKLMFVKPS